MRPFGAPLPAPPPPFHAVSGTPGGEQALRWSQQLAARSHERVMGGGGRAAVWTLNFLCERISIWWSGRTIRDEESQEFEYFHQRFYIEARMKSWNKLTEEIYVFIPHSQTEEFCNLRATSRKKEQKLDKGLKVTVETNVSASKEGCACRTLKAQV